MAAKTSGTPFSLFVPERLLTIADLAVLPKELPSGPVRFELHQGKLFPLSPSLPEHADALSRLAAAFEVQGEQQDRGKCACGDIRIIVGHSPDWLLTADAIFVARRALPFRRSSEGFLETIPALIVELLSKDDPIPNLEQRIAVFLRAGVQVHWTVDFDARTVTELRTAQPPKVYQEADTLTVEDLIPGFQFPVRSLFGA